MPRSKPPVPVNRAEASRWWPAKSGRWPSAARKRPRRRVSNLLGEISAATLEQTSGIGQVNDAVTQLDQVTQQNAALVEESAAAADSLRMQADRLVQTVAAFRTAETA